MYHLITLAVFVLFTVGCAAISFFRPMKKNILTFITLPISFGITVLLEVLGVLGFLGDVVVNILNKFEVFAGIVEASETGTAFVRAIIATFSSAVLFPIVFFIIYLIFGIILSATKYFPKMMNFGWYSASNMALDPSERKEAIGLRFGSAGIGLVLGFILSAIVLTPVFYVESYAEVATQCERNTVEVDSVGVREAIKKVDDAFITPYENLFSTKVYNALGCSKLLVTIIDRSSVSTVNGEKINCAKALRDVAAPGLKVYTQIHAIHESDKAIAGEFDKLAENKLVLQVLADIVAYENKCIGEKKKGIFLDPAKPYTLSPTFEEYILGVVVTSYDAPDKAAILSDVTVILESCHTLAEKEFFNDFFVEYDKQSRIDLVNADNTAFATVLAKNARFIGSILDSIYAKDKSQVLAQRAMKMLATVDGISKVFTQDEIAKLNSGVKAGTTTYEQYFTVLENLVNNLA